MKEGTTSRGRFIDTDSYVTPENTPRAFFDKILFGGSLYFWIMFISQLFKSRKTALNGRFDTHTWASRSMDIFELIERCGGKFDIRGLDHIQSSKEPVVFVSNHMSMLESMVLPGLIASRREVTFVVKKSLTTHPIFGPVMRARGPIAVDRQDPISDFKKVMLDGTESLKNNVSVVIFPQSQRMVKFNPKQFNTLGIKLAKNANVKVVPLAIKTDFWENGTLLKDIGVIHRDLRIYFEFGEPISIDGAGKKEQQMIIDHIHSHLKKWGGQVED